MNDMNCDQCRPYLFELLDGGRIDERSGETRRRVDAHLESCPDCQTALSELWQLEAAATRWESERVPAWNRRSAFFEARSWLPLTQMIGAAASVVLLVIVVSQLRIDTSDGLTVAFGPDYVTEQEIGDRLAALETGLENELERLQQQQATGDQLVLTSLLQASRRERRDDLADLVSVLSDAEARRDIRTTEALQYLISTQQEDRKDIQQLNEAIQLVGNTGGTL